MADDNVNYDDGLQNDPEDTNPIDDMKRDQELPGDHGTPLSDPAASGDDSPSNQQITDTNVDPDKKYQEGLASAAEAHESDMADDRAVGNYDPEEEDENAAQ